MHFIEKKIYYHDTDCGGVVYYANYLKYLEEARTEYFLSRGIRLKELAQTGIWFAVSSLNIDYKLPARYQDILKVFTTIKKIKTATIHFSQKILRDKALIVQAQTTLVCVDKNFRPKSIPQKLKQSLSVGIDSLECKLRV
jgi:acyl-CoA thioester hydrolase